MTFPVRDGGADQRRREHLAQQYHLGSKALDELRIRAMESAVEDNEGRYWERADRFVWGVLALRGPRELTLTQLSWARRLVDDLNRDNDHYTGPDAGSAPPSPEGGTP